MSWTPLVGHEEPLARLRRAAKEGRLGHGYLFVGPAGVGKRRCADHVAQGLLCETRAEAALDPCGRCSACVEVAAGAHPDLSTLEKPADKSVIPVEKMMEFCQQLSLRPARGRRRIAIIDDADALDTAANALLKTLEEPPPGSLLILVGTSEEAQLPTILSRVQTVRFRPLAEEQAATVLMASGAAGNLDEARRWARLGGGSVGQAAELAAPEWQEFRTKLLDGLTNINMPRHLLAREVLKFLEDAGKESAPKRGRAQRAVGLAAELYRDALRRRAAGRLPEDPVEAARAEAVAAAGSELALLDLLERCLAAEGQIDRNLALSLTMECWLDDLAQISAGQYAAPVAEGW